MGGSSLYFSRYIPNTALPLYRQGPRVLPGNGIRNFRWVPLTDSSLGGRSTSGMSNDHVPGIWEREILVANLMVAGGFMGMKTNIN